VMVVKSIYQVKRILGPIEQAQQSLDIGFLCSFVLLFGVMCLQEVSMDGSGN